jgi:hypothetical protein
MTEAEGLEQYRSITTRNRFFLIAPNVLPAAFFMVMVVSVLTCIWTFGAQSSFTHEFAGWAAWCALAACVVSLVVALRRIPMLNEYNRQRKNCKIAYGRKPDGGYATSVVEWDGDEAKIRGQPGIYILFPFNEKKKGYAFVGCLDPDAYEEENLIDLQLEHWRFEPLCLEERADDACVRLVDPQGNGSMAMSLPAAMDFLLRAGIGNLLQNSFPGAVDALARKNSMQSELLESLEKANRDLLARLGRTLNLVVGLARDLDLQEGAVLVPEATRSLRERVVSVLETFPPAMVASLCALQSIGSPNDDEPYPEGDEKAEPPASEQSSTAGAEPRPAEDKPAEANDPHSDGGCCGCGP